MLLLFVPAAGALSAVLPLREVRCLPYYGNSRLGLGLGRFSARMASFGKNVFSYWGPFSRFAVRPAEPAHTDTASGVPLQHYNVAPDRSALCRGRWGRVPGPECIEQAEPWAAIGVEKITHCSRVPCGDKDSRRLFPRTGTGHTDG